MEMILKIVRFGGAAMFTLVFLCFTIVAIILNEVMDAITHIYYEIRNIKHTFFEVLKETTV